MGNKWQLCPKCNGAGYVGKPPWVAGDTHQWTASQTSFTCDICLGQKVLRAPDDRPVWYKPGEVGDE